MKTLLRVWAFYTKELRTVFRQKRLLGSLVLGPFLILGLFGLGFKGGQPPIKTLLVVPPGQQMEQDVDQIRQAMSGGSFEIVGTTPTEADARGALDRRDVDAVVVIPGNAFDQIYNGQPAQVAVLVNAIDPVRRAWVDYNTYVASSSINRSIMVEALREGTSPIKQLASLTGELKADADALRGDMDAGNLPSARARAERMRATSATARTALDATQSSLQSSAQSLGARAGAAALARSAAHLDAIDNDLAGLTTGLNSGDTSSPQQRQRVQSLQNESSGLNDEAKKVAAIPPEVLVSPLSAKTENIAAIEPNYLSFYAPAVLALLLQHLGLTLIALSIVRERQLGTIELFRVSPVPSATIAIGKLLAYATLSGLLAAILTLLVKFGLNVPVIGRPEFVAASFAALIFASLALGLLIATFSRTENQAVQFAMLSLIASVFFGGFFIQIESLQPFARVLSYVLPVTYGIRNLQDVMLRGVRPNDLWLWAPVAVGLVAYLIGFRRLHSELRSG